MDELKEALIYAINISKAESKVELFTELLSLLYASAYSDGQHYIIQRQYEEEHPCCNCQEWDCGECVYHDRREQQ